MHAQKTEQVSGLSPSERWTGPRVVRAVAGTAAVVGAAAAVYYARLGLTLSHYDAKAHLVVARRILDSLTPGWEQIGAVWLPLPHLVNALPVQVDLLYRTGLFAVIVSVAAHALAAAAIAATILMLTASRAAAVFGAAAYVLNPNTLYLQSTPMTEPMLFGLSALQVALFTRWVIDGDLRVPRRAGWITILACLTRYEAWAVTAACLATSAVAWRRRGATVADLVPVYTRLALYPAVAILGFMAFSRVTVGEWFVSSGFFVPDESLQGQPGVVIERIAEGVEMLAGTTLLWTGVAGLAAVAVVGLSFAHRAPALVALSLAAAGALPLAAYLAGHPFRIRYEIGLVVAAALSSGVALGLIRRIAPYAAPALLALVLLEARPLSPDAPMVREAQRDTRAAAARATVTSCLARQYRGGAIMASMGSLGHYMHEMSAAGFSIRDFLHEGNGPLWNSAFTRGPAPLVEWVLIEEAAEGGDAVTQRRRAVPALLRDFVRVCEGGGVALYRRVLSNAPARPTDANRIERPRPSAQDDGRGPRGR